MKTFDAALQKVLTVCACYYITVFCVVGALRMSFPGALEWLESTMYCQMLRALAGQALYVAPSLEYVPALYPPLYFYIAAAVARITGPEFSALRLVSYVSSLGSMALIGYLVCRTGRSRIAGLWAAGLFAATYHVSATYFDVGRVDSLFLFLCLGSLTAMAAAPGWQAWLPAALLLVCAAFTKQTAVLVFPPLFLYLFFFRSRAQALGFTGLFIITAGLLSLWLNAATRDWYFFYTLELPGQHPVVWPKMISFWLYQVLEPLPIATCLAVCSLVLISLKKSRILALVYALCFIALLAASFLPWIKIGGFKNVMLPAYAAIALGAGLTLAFPWTQWVRRLLLIAVCLQFALLWYNPGPVIPTAENAEIVHKTIAAIKKINGSVLAPANGYLLLKAGRPHSAHIGTIEDIIYTEPGAVRDRLIRDIIEALRERRFDVILLDRNFRFFQREIETNYIPCPQYARAPELRPLVKLWCIPRSQQR